MREHASRGSSCHFRGTSGPSFSRAMAATSPGSACRLSDSLEKTRPPSMVTSKRPVDAGTNSTVSLIDAIGGGGGLPGDPLARGKKSIGLNLKSAEGQAVLHRMVEGADVVLEGFRPGVTDRIGAGYEQLSKINPRIVYCSLTGWGQEGPLAQTAGHDIDYIAIAGALEPVGRENERPVPALNMIADFAGGGLMAAFGIVCALLERERSGEGQYIDAAMLDGAASLMSMHYGFHNAGVPV